MTDIPEHLLRRSRERREALGLSSGEGGAPPAGDGGGGTSEAAEPSGAPAPSTAPAPVAAAAPAVPEPTPAPEPLPPYVASAMSRPRIPRWAMPVLAALPLWAIIYAGTMVSPPAAADDPLTIGEEVFRGNCATCHGASGGGGVGPKLSGGAVETTFPDPAEHLDFVKTGSAPYKGGTYGDPDRPNPRVATGQMPAWGDQLSPEELIGVVRYEREVLSNAEPWEEASAEGGPGEASGEGESGGSSNEGGDTNDTGEAQQEGGDVGGEGSTSDQGGESSSDSEGADGGGQSDSGDTSEQPQGSGG